MRGQYRDNLEALFVTQNVWFDRQVGKSLTDDKNCVLFHISLSSTNLAKQTFDGSVRSFPVVLDTRFLHKHLHGLQNNWELTHVYFRLQVKVQWGKVTPLWVPEMSERVEPVTSEPGLDGPLVHSVHDARLEVLDLHHLPLAQLQDDAAGPRRPVVRVHEIGVLESEANPVHEEVEGAVIFIAVFGGKKSADERLKRKDVLQHTSHADLPAEPALLETNVTS